MAPWTFAGVVGISIATVCGIKGDVLSISSMTGYARAEGRDENAAWVWEAKSVNGRGLDLRLRVPPGFDALDVAARELAAKVLKRGNIQLNLNVSLQSEGAAASVNGAFLEQILAVCDQLKERYPHVAAPSWDGLLGIKGVIETTQDQETVAGPERAALIRKSLERVLADLVAMRQSEGGRIAAILSAQLDEIERLFTKAAGLACLRAEAQKERLRTQVSALLDASSTLSEDRLNAEVALLAVKADVREELDRLASHVAASRELVESGGAIGRKLDFLAQEFNRESNTVCSKAQDVELTRLGLDLKVVIDQFREQVQNIE